MVKGIGIDTASIDRIRNMMAALNEGALARLYTPAELAAAKERHDPADYLASRFAAKEAVFKALAHLTPEKRFDLRIVETLNDEEGCPAVTQSDDLAAVMAKAGVTTILISITTEGGLATAFVAVTDD